MGQISRGRRVGGGELLFQRVRRLPRSTSLSTCTKTSTEYFSFNVYEDYHGVLLFQRVLLFHETKPNTLYAPSLSTDFSLQRLSSLSHHETSLSTPTFSLPPGIFSFNVHMTLTPCRETTRTLLVCVCQDFCRETTPCRHRL